MSRFLALSVAAAITLFLAGPAMAQVNIVGEVTATGEVTVSGDVIFQETDVQVQDNEVVNKFFECTRYTKAQVNYWKNTSWHATASHARDWLAIHYTSLEPHEGMTAFTEKRKADYVGMRRRASSGGSSEFLWGPYAKTCGKCGAKGIPAHFEFCGVCGEGLVCQEE